jgi:Putative prokaryotic signal transducing protein
MGKGDDLVLIGVASSQVEATIWRDALEQEGIRAFVRNRDPLAAAGMPLRFDRLEVFVLARDERRARWVIGEAMEPGEVASQAVEDQAQEHASRE